MPHVSLARQPAAEAVMPRTCRPAPDTLASRREEIEELREENRQLKDLLMPPGHLPLAWGLTPIKAMIVKALARTNGAPIRTDRLLEIIYGLDHERDRTSIHVAICKIRRKRDRHGLAVSTHYGDGHALTPESCRIVRAALDPRPCATAPIPGEMA